MTTERSEGRALGRYLLFDEIAKGGMATIHLGRLSGPIGFSRTVAIKRLHPHIATDPEFVAMFVDEARLAARIRHPNVVPTIDVVTDEREVFIVMEYMLGSTLSQLARKVRARNERVPIRYTLATVAGALHGLHAAHEVTDEAGRPLGIVHRDVSPQNIFVGTDGVTRVIDFGVAKARGRLAETGDSASLKGKISYMAPEQVAGSGVTHKTDIYAAAVILWELLAGQRLVEGETEAQRAAMILWASAGGGIDPPSKHNPEVPPELDAIVMKGLAPAHQRWDSAQEMAVALERSGGLVPTTEIGAWVTSLAGAELQSRASRLKEIESRTMSVPSLPVSGALEPRPSSAAPVVVTAKARSRPWRIPMLLVAGLVIGFLGWRLGRTRARQTTSTPVSSVAVAPVLDAGPVSITSAAPVVSDSATMSAAPKPVPPVVPRPKPQANPKPKLAADCDPPYTIDDDNHKIYKRQCIK